MVKKNKMIGYTCQVVKGYTGIRAPTYFFATKKRNDNPADPCAGIRELLAGFVWEGSRLPLRESGSDFLVDRQKKKAMGLPRQRGTGPFYHQLGMKK